MISISTSNLCVRVGARDILTGVNFSLEDGDRLGNPMGNGGGLEGRRYKPPLRTAAAMATTY